MTRLSTPVLLVLLLAAGSLFAQGQESDLHRRESNQKVLFFDGVDDYAQAPLLDFNKFTDGFTVEAWHMNWSGYILSQGAVGDPENSLWLSTGDALFDGCGWEDNEREPNDNYAQNVGLFRPGKWTHLAMVFDGKKQMIFVNGKLIGARLFPAPGALTKNRGFTVGAEPNYNEGGSWSFGAGFLRAVRVSSVARYDCEFHPATTLKSDAETVVLYSSTAVEGDQLVDLSGNKHHAKLHGTGLQSPKSVATRLIEGSVFDPDGNLATGVLVFLQRKEKYIAITKTDDSGRYFFVLNNPVGKCNIESGDWTRTVAGRWASTMEGEVAGIAVDKSDGTHVDVKLRDTATPQAESGDVLVAPAFAQQSSREDFQRFCHAIHGRWVGDVTWVADWPGLGNKGENVTAYWEGRVAEDGNVMVGKFFGGDGSETSLIYFDAAAKQIRWMMVSSGGSVTRSVVYWKDGKWNQKGRGSLLDGTKIEYTNNATISGDGNTWTWEGSGTVGDKPNADQHDVWRRVSR